MTGRATRIVVLALIALGAVPAVATAASCPSGSANLAEISVYTPELVRSGADFTVELEGEAVTADGYANVVVRVGDVPSPVALEGFGEASVTVRAPLRTGQVPVTVTWDQAAGADGVGTSGTPVGACSGSITTDVLVADWSGAVGDIQAPRVQGSWRFTLTSAAGKRSRYAWPARPSCGIGACDVALSMGRPWGPVPLRLAGRTYRGSDVGRVHGVLCDVNGRDVRGPADFNVRVWLSVAGRRLVRGQLVATRVTGWLVTWLDNPGGAISSCGSTPRVRERIAAVPG